MSNDIIQGFLNIVQGDDSTYPRAISGYEGSDNIRTVRQSVYGVCSNPPKNSLGILFKISGMDGVRYGIYDDTVNRFKNLSESEVQIGNYSTKASIKFDKDGNITIDVPSGDLTANINGNLTADVAGTTTIDTGAIVINASGGSTINGDLSVNGSVSANNFLSITSGFNFNSHVHTGDSGGTTSAPDG